MSIQLKDILEFLQNPDNKEQVEALFGKKETAQKKGRGRPKKVVASQSVVDEEVEDLTGEAEEVSDDTEIVDLTKKGNGGSKKKGKLCRRVSINIDNRKNHFKDDGHIFLEDYETFDKKILGNVKGKIRKKKKPTRFKVRCRECKDIFIIDEPPITYEAGVDGSATYVCDSCIPSR